MSDYSPHYATCVLCGDDATDWRTVRIGEHEAHQRCVDESDEIVRCCMCRALTLAEDAGAWIRHPEGRLCPDCAETTEPENMILELTNDLKT